MKTKIKLLTLFLIVSTFISTSKVSAQTTIWPAFAGPARDEIWSGQNIEQIVGGISTETYLKGFGLNNYFNGSSKIPGYMFDVYCDPTNSTLTDINVSCPNCTPANSVGYRIGGQMVLWYWNSTSDIYVGVGAGGSGAGNCTGVGYNALNNNTGTSNTAMGYSALASGVTGSSNTAVGTSALTSNTVGFGNTAMGYYSLLHNISGYNNTAAGAV